MHIKVEKRHIEAAREHAQEHYDICRNCPMAQALREKIPDFDTIGYTEIKFKDGSYVYIDDPDDSIRKAVFNYGYYPYTNFPELEFDVNI